MGMLPILVGRTPWRTPWSALVPRTRTSRHRSRTRGGPGGPPHHLYRSRHLWRRNRWIVRRARGIKPQRVQVADSHKTRRVSPQCGVVEFYGRDMLW